MGSHILDMVAFVWTFIRLVCARSFSREKKMDHHLRIHNKKFLRCLNANVNEEKKREREEKDGKKRNGGKMGKRKQDQVFLM